MEGNRNTDRTGSLHRIVITDGGAGCPETKSVITIRFRLDHESVFPLPNFPSSK